MRRSYKVDPCITKAVIERLYGRYPAWVIGEVLGLKPQTIGVYARKYGLTNRERGFMMVRNKTLRKLLLEVVKREVEKIKRELNLDS